MKKYIQYGCGWSCPENWENYDASPTLRIQKLPLIGRLLKPYLNTTFPEGVKYGNIIKGLPSIKNDSCDGLYCSHILEHLALNDLRVALKNSYKYLKKGGRFRLVLPDLEVHVKIYLENKLKNDPKAAMKFVNDYTILGQVERRVGPKGVLDFLYSNHSHRWMWDFESLRIELQNVGFSSIRKCSFNDSEDDMFKLVEDESRFIEYMASEKNFYPALAIECIK